MRNNILTDDICDKISQLAYQKAQELNIDISIAIYDENAMPLYYKRYNEAPILSTKLAPAKAYTSAIMSMKTEDLKKLCTDGGPLMGLDNLDSKITLVAGGCPLFKDDTLVGAIGIGGGKRNEDSIICDYLTDEFKKLVE